MPDPYDEALDAPDVAQDPAEVGSERPWLSISEAAEAAGLDRRSIRRRLDAGRFPKARRDDVDGRWLISVTDLVAAGLKLHAPTPGDEADEDPDTVDDLRTALVDERHRRELAEVERDAAREIAAERAEALADARLALRALMPAAEAIPPPVPASETSPRRRWWRKA